MCELAKIIRIIDREKKKQRFFHLDPFERIFIKKQ